MGVKGLFAFLSRVAEVRPLRDGSEKDKVKIAVDGSALLFWIKDEGISKILPKNAVYRTDLGCQAWLVERATKAFVYTMRRNGLEPVFVLEGGCADTKMDEKVRRYRERMEELTQAMERFCSVGNRLGDSDQGNSFSIMPLLMSSVMYETLAKMGCDMKVPVGEGDAFVAFLVKSGYCKACLSGDSDMIIFGVPTFNIHTMQIELIDEDDIASMMGGLRISKRCTVKAEYFDPGKVRAALAFDQRLYPLLAALAGCDITKEHSRDLQRILPRGVASKPLARIQKYLTDNGRRFLSNIDRAPSLLFPQNSVNAKLVRDTIEFYRIPASEDAIATEYIPEFIRPYYVSHGLNHYIDALAFHFTTTKTCVECMTSPDKCVSFVTKKYNLPFPCNSKVYTSLFFRQCSLMTDTPIAVKICECAYGNVSVVRYEVAPFYEERHNFFEDPEEERLRLLLWIFHCPPGMLTVADFKSMDLVIVLAKMFFAFVENGCIYGKETKIFKQVDLSFIRSLLRYFAHFRNGNPPMTALQSTPPGFTIPAAHGVHLFNILNTFLNELFRADKLLGKLHAEPLSNLLSIIDSITFSNILCATLVDVSKPTDDETAFAELVLTPKQFDAFKSHVAS